MTEQARPFKNIQNRVEVLGAPPTEVEAPERPVVRVGPQSGWGEVTPRRGAPPTLLADLFQWGWANREKLIWLAIIGLAVFTRLWDLAPRAFHHDESIHGVFSYEMFTGKNIYRYDPTWHGPVLYYMVTLAYFLFGGASEFSARFAPAVFGIGLIALSYYLRPLIGRLGAIIFAVLLLVSPSIMYYSRSLRHDIFATFGMMLFVIGLFRFAQTRQNTGHPVRWMALSGIGFFILFGSHEMSFLNLAIVLTWLGIVFLFEIIALPGWVRRRGSGVGSRESGEMPSAPDNLASIEARPQAASYNQQSYMRQSDDEDELDDPLVLEPELAYQPTLEGFGDVPTAPAQVAPLDEAVTAAPTLNYALSSPRYEDRSATGRKPLIANGLMVYPVIFGLLALLVLTGSYHLFVDRAADGSLQKLFEINAYWTLIPFYLLLAVGAAWLLTRLITMAYRHLSPRNYFIAQVTAAGIFLLLGLVATALFWRSGSPAASLTAANLQFSGSTSPGLGDAIAQGATLSQFAYGGLKWPSLLPQLVVVAIVALLSGALVGWLWERGWLTYTRKGLYGLGIAAGFVFIVAALVSLRFSALPPGTPLPKLTLPVVGTLDKWQVYLFGGLGLALVIGFLAGWFVSLAEQISDAAMAGSAVFRAILRFARNPWSVLAWLLGFGILYVLIFSNFFFSPERLADGFYRGLEYWGEQHGKRRLDQPWFYYPMLMLLYETFAVMFTLIAAVYFPVSWWRRTAGRGRIVFTARGVFIGLAFWWSLLALIIYSIAGEKIPWLNMQIALPFSLATAAFLNDYLTRLDWRQLFAWKAGLRFAGLFLGMLAVSFALAGLLISFPKKGAYTPGLNRVATDNDLIMASIQIGVLGLVLFGLLSYSLGLWWNRDISGPVARAAILLSVGLIVFLYCVKSTIALNFQHPDTPVEPLIYTQTAPEVPLFVERVGRLSRDIRDLYKPAVAETPPGQPAPTYPDPANGRGIPMYVSNQVDWPLHWYFRDYTDVTWGVIGSDQNAPVLDKLTDSRGNNYALILVSTGENTSRLQEQLAGQYTAQQYRFRWHFPEDDSSYGGLGYVPLDDTREFRIASKDIVNTRWDIFVRSFTEQPFAGRLWRYLAYRQLWQPLQSFDMVAYVRNDLYADFALTANTRTTPGINPADTLPAFDLTTATSAGTRNGQYRTPRNVAVAPNGDILVLDSLNGRIQRFDKDGKYLSKFGTIGSGDGQFTLAQYESGPGGITLDEEGNTYVADAWNYRIQKFDPNGKLLLKWGMALDTKGELTANQQSPQGFYGPRAIAYDRTTQELYITDTGNRRVVVYDKQGQFKRQFGSTGNGPGQFNEPVGIAISADSKIYIADMRNKRIQILDNQGQFLSEIAVPSWREAPLSEPYLTFNPQGELFVSDPANAAILRFDAKGQLTKTYNSSNGLSLINPVGLAFDSTGNLYIADARRNTIVKFKP